MDKRGSGGLIAIIIILILLVFVIFLVEIAQRDCNSNRDCPANAYCGSDHECHEYPQQILMRDNNLILPALILGLALIIAARIFRGGNKPKLPRVGKMFDLSKHDDHDSHGGGDH